MGFKVRAGASAGAGRTRSQAMRAFALGLPGATEEFPWGESVAKVRGKVFVFLGRDPGPDGDFGMSVKLPHSGPGLVEMPFAEPTGYGLGRSGWVSITAGPDIPDELLQQWILESYRAIAPKKLIAELDSRA